LPSRKAGSAVLCDTVRTWFARVGFCDPLRLMIVVLVAATAVTVLNNSMITVVLAAVGRDLSATPSALGWTATGYLLPFAAGNALAGRLSDRVSLRRVFMLGLVVFAVGTVAAATAPSVTWLIIARGVQGAGGSVVPALSAVAIARVFEAGRRGPAFGLLAAGTGAAQAAGPVLGGVLGQVAGWRSLFWVSTALVVPVLIGAARTLGAADHPAATPGAELSPESAFRVASFAGTCGVGLLALLTYLAVEILIPLQVAEPSRRSRRPLPLRRQPRPAHHHRTPRSSPVLQPRQLVRHRHPRHLHRLPHRHPAHTFPIPPGTTS